MKFLPKFEITIKLQQFLSGILWTGYMNVWIRNFSSVSASTSCNKSICIVSAKRFSGDDKTVQQVNTAKAEAEPKAKESAALAEAEREANEAADSLTEATGKFKDSPVKVVVVSTVDEKDVGSAGW